MDVDHDHQPLESLPFMRAMDIILVEGFKRAPLPKIEVFRPENGKPPACKGDRHLLAVVSTTTLDWGIPVYSPDDIEGLCDFILYRLLPEFSMNGVCGRAICS